MIGDEIEKARQEVRTASKKLLDLQNRAHYVCPLCASEMAYHKGRFNDSGGAHPPSVSCKCGFKFSRDLGDFPGAGRKDNSGWEIMAAQMSEAEKDIEQKFLKEKPTN